jgi:SAM-dependent methyltransferase
VTEYYRDGRLLQAKNELAAASFDVAGWALDHLDLTGVHRALDAGCGWGRFAGPLLERAPRIELVCTDLEPGMAATCRSNVATASVTAADVERLPFASSSFDLVLANHMLYLFDDPRRAVAALARVVRRDGIVAATTYADREVPLLTFHRRALGVIGRSVNAEEPSSFSLANGAAVLGSAFESVHVETFDVVEPVDPVAMTAIYENTGAFAAVGTAELLDAFRLEVERAVTDDPDLATTTTWTMFVARRPRYEDETL